MTQYSSCPSSARNWRFWFLPASFALVLALVTCVLLSGCGGDSGAKSSISQLEKAFAAAAAPASAEQAAPGSAPRSDAQGYVQTAISALRSNDYAAAVVMLKAATRAPGLTPDQFVTVQQTKNALLTNLGNRAKKGDPHADAALKSIQQAGSD